MAEKRTILVVDDSAINRKILCKILSTEYNTVEAENGRIALEILREQKEGISAVLLDLVMPEMDGYGFLEEQRKDDTISNTPVIVTTQKEGEEVEVKALSLGAYDFLTKPYKPSIICQRLANTIRFRETAAFANTVERDVLTGLYNKEAFYSLAAKRIKNKKDIDYDLICLDVDKFKLINDMFGAEEGDRLLMYIGKLIKEIASPLKGIACRISADTFVILLPRQKDYESNMVQATTDLLSKYPLKIKISVRFGIYPVIGDGVPVRAMCDRAKLAIESIKGRYDLYHVFYDDSIREQLLFEQSISDDMKTALKEGQFLIYYQPKYDLMTENIAGAEALVRWLHPEKGFLFPSDFIPLFEKNGFITDLDMYVWEEVCKRIRVWLDMGRKAPSISVNVSRADIYNPHLPEVILGLIDKYKLEPKNLHLEITETAYTENPVQLIEVVSKLKEYGFSIEMDDFGSGYSSLNMLSELPIDILKLDMRFLQNQSTQRESKNIISFIISLAKWMDLLVVAEGVETEQQVKMLRNMDCNYVQGYYYSKPLPQKEFEDLLLCSEIEQMEKQKKIYPEGMGERVSITDSLGGVEYGYQQMLIVDDISVNREILMEIFREKYTIVEAENGEVALHYIREHAEEIDIILLDLIMPMMDGFQLLEKVKEDERTNKIPVIITSQAGEESEEKALLMGAADFIAKPYSPEVALRRVENVMADTRVKALEREKNLAQKMLELQEFSKKDALTGLYHRGELQLQVDHFFAMHTAGNCAFVMLDIDWFKQINDTLGHLKGDQVLCDVAKILKEFFRPEDIVSRMGGDEFVIFIPTAISFMDLNLKMDALCKRMEFIEGEISISCSLGVCQGPLFGQDYQTLYQNADLALLTAKRLGKSRYQIFDSEMKTPSPVLLNNMDWLLDETSDAVFVCDTENYKLLYLNEVAREMAQKTKGSCIGEKCYEVLWGREDPCTCCQIEEMNADVFDEKEIWREEIKRNFILKRKLVKWDGKNALVEYIQDNTLRFRMQKKLEQDVAEFKKNNEKMAGMLGALQSGLVKCSVDQYWTVLEANEKFYNMIGYTKEEFQQEHRNHLVQMIRPDYLQQNMMEMKKQLKSGNMAVLESCLVTKTGASIFVMDQTIVLEESDGNTYYYCTYIDITKQKTCVER